MTMSGKLLCLLTLGVGFGAVNTGNNLLFLLLGMMLSLILGSGVLSEAVLRDVSARRRLPRRFVAGAAVPGGFEVTTMSPRPSMSLEIADRTALCIEGPAAGRTFGYVPEKWWKVWKKDPDTPPVATAYSIRVEGESTAELSTRYMLPTRGRWRLAEVSLATRFPFGFFEKVRKQRDAVEVVVFPVADDVRDWSGLIQRSFGEVPSMRRGPGDEYFGLREYRPGEDRRSIHWKASARRGQLVVRETERLSQREVEVVFGDWSAKPPRPEVFERAVRRTAGLVQELLSDGYRVGFRMRGDTIEPGIGTRHADLILTQLAVAAWHPQPPPPAPEVAADLSRVGVGTPETAAALTLPVDLVLAVEDP